MELLLRQKYALLRHNIYFTLKITLKLFQNRFLRKLVVDCFQTLVSLKDK